MLLSAAYQGDRTRMSNRICFQLLYLTSAAIPGWTFNKCPAERKAANVVCNFSFFICYISLLCDEKYQQNIFKAVIHRSIFIQQQQVFQGDPILLGRQKFVNVTSRLQNQKSVHTTRGLAKCLATECVFQLFVYCVSFGPRAT